MDIEEAFRVASGVADRLDEERAYWLDEISLDFLRTASEEETLNLNQAAVNSVQTLVRVAFLAGQLTITEQEPQYDDANSVEEKFRLISGFIDLINNRTGE